MKNSQIKSELRKMAERLTVLGYAEFYNCFFPLDNSPFRWKLARESATQSLRPVVDLFLLGRAVPFSMLDSELAEIIRSLEPYGLFILEPEDCVRTSGFVLHTVFGLWLFYEIPNPKISLYLGMDSFALLTHQLPRRGDKCLDLCSGPGVQALYAARAGEIVTSMEINPVAADLAHINAMINDLDDVMDIRNGSLYASLGEMRFDHVLANPPLLPFPEEIPYAFVGHGGNDGLKVTWRILEGLNTHLTKDGYAQIIGVGLSHKRAPCFAPRMKEVAAEYGLDILLNIVNCFSIERGADYFNGLAQTSHEYCGIPLEQIEDAMEQCFTLQKATEFIVFYLYARLGTGNFTVQNLSGIGNAGLWYL